MNLNLSEDTNQACLKLKCPLTQTEDVCFDTLIK